MHIEQTPRRQHRIGLTPLIDVVFILLVFFMLATSLLDWRQVALATGSGETEADQTPPAVVRLSADGGLHYQDQVFSVEELASRLQRELRAGDISAAILRPGPEVSLAPTVRALDALAGAGIDKLTLSESTGE